MASCSLYCSENTELAGYGEGQSQRARTKLGGGFNKCNSVKECSKVL